ncbi:uncharacterized mitochondrial protein AtMg00810-like [Stegodyphus dumicola]|uniref:uncharacterized mitochondrial protein AtMg00810-like n=1 Tax=Stegodyphus dumicola TaxID=202533 RepID=UPI0015B06D21|nr:uncharacterized mitochondrial protein AtMg00810-like [Stegodyphus dumicola]
MEQPPGFISDPNKVYLVNKSIYGQPQSENAAVYVDDLMVIGNSNSEINDIISQLSKSFTLREDTKTQNFLGIDIRQESGKLILSKENYITEILKNFEMDECKPVKTPGILGENLDDIASSPPVSKTKYQEAALGSIDVLSNRHKARLSFC